jgi:hypothetical protein
MGECAQGRSDRFNRRLLRQFRGSTMTPDWAYCPSGQEDESNSQRLGLASGSRGRSGIEAVLRAGAESHLVGAAYPPDAAA